MDNSTWYGGFASSGAEKFHVVCEADERWAWKYDMSDKVRRSDGVCRASNGETGADVKVYIFVLWLWVEAKAKVGGGDDVHPGAGISESSYGLSNPNIWVGDAASSIAWSSSSPSPFTHPWVLITIGTTLEILPVVL